MRGGYCRLKISHIEILKPWQLCVSEPVRLTKWNLPVLNLETMVTSEPDVFVGGDVGGVTNTTAESVNDGKQAARYVHQYLQVFVCSSHVCETLSLE